ncbi:MAG: Mlr1315 protein [uncultured Sulfurovum sp.]|uniref:Mlr1315 protein n=1 Tax=uncultured Sulfurovum sp. TaxID=269237 RepID=A0A6S6U0G0_9BACT|nr:MAG: Mlr1315 protein [uncultured Sulfurovum sp.]
MKEQRLNGLDIFRGMAILLMIMYHFTFDLNYFKIIAINMDETTTFLIMRYTIISMFLFTVGVSLGLNHQKEIQWKSVRKRMLQLGTASIMVSIATYVVFPISWVYFGILHFILVASLMTLPLIKFPKTSLILSLFILLGSASGFLNLHPLFNLLQAPLNLPTIYCEDLVPLFPWWSVVLLGTVSVHYQIHHKIFNANIFTQNSKINTLLKKMGQYSLLIYLIHQPILFATFELYFRFFSK